MLTCTPYIRRKKKVRTEKRLHNKSIFFDSNLLVTSIRRPTTLQLTAREPCLFVSRVVHHAKYSGKYLGYISSLHFPGPRILFRVRRVYFSLSSVFLCIAAHKRCHAIFIRFPHLVPYLGSPLSTFPTDASRNPSLTHSFTSSEQCHVPS